MFSTRFASLVIPTLAALLGAAACSSSDDAGNRRLRLIAEGDDCAEVTQVCVAPNGGDTECFPACIDDGGDDAEPPPGYDCVDVGVSPGSPGDDAGADGEPRDDDGQAEDAEPYELCFPTGCDVAVSDDGETIGTVDCEDIPPSDGGTVCPEIYAPVCADGVTYSSDCVAEANGVTDYTAGECPEA